MMKSSLKIKTLPFLAAGLILERRALLGALWRFQELAEQCSARHSLEFADHLFCAASPLPRKHH
jgi:hypothetical protein